MWTNLPVFWSWLLLLIFLHVSEPFGSHQPLLFRRAVGPSCSGLEVGNAYTPLVSALLCAPRPHSPLRRLILSPHRSFDKSFSWNLRAENANPASRDHKHESNGKDLVRSSTFVSDPSALLSEEVLELNEMAKEGLDWGRLWVDIAGMAVTDIGRRQVLGTSPVVDLAALKLEMEGVAEALAIVKQFQGLPLFGIQDVGFILSRLGKGSTLGTSEVGLVSETLQALLRLQSHVDSAAFQLDHPVLESIWRNSEAYVDLDLITEFRNAVDDEGNLVDPQVKTARHQFVHALAALEEAQTGLEIAQRKQSYAVAEAELQRQEERALTRLSVLLTPHVSGVQSALNAAARLDSFWARAVFAHKTKGIRPSVLKDGVFNATGCRHPILELRGVTPVPHDICLDSTSPAMVITGPNGGGKTVVLKTVGLLALLVAHGCWIPCDPGSRVDLFELVAVSIGDKQDVLEDLSTFSSHVDEMATILQAASHCRTQSLVLLDEPCSGTDPQEGSALAQAMLESLVGSGSRLLVTTHYASVKSISVMDNRFSVAAMRWDDSRPSFALLQGVVGQSRPIEAAKRAQIPSSVIARATSLLGNHAQLMNGMDALEESKLLLQDIQDRTKELNFSMSETEARILKLEYDIAVNIYRTKRVGAQNFRLALREAYDRLQSARQQAVEREEAWYGIGVDDPGEWDFYAGAEDGFQNTGGVAGGSSRRGGNKRSKK